MILGEGWGFHACCRFAMFSEKLRTGLDREHRVFVTWAGVASNRTEARRGRVAQLCCCFTGLRRWHPEVAMPRVHDVAKTTSPKEEEVLQEAVDPESCSLLDEDSMWSRIR